MSPCLYKVQKYSKLISLYFPYVCMKACVLSDCLKAKSVLQTRTPGGRAYHSFEAIIQLLDHDHGQTYLRTRDQRLSAAQHKVTWWILIGFKYSTARAKQSLPCVKRKVTVCVTCQCSKNRCFWRVIDHKYQALCCAAWCTVLFRSI